MHRLLPALLVPLWLAGCGGGGPSGEDPNEDPTVILGSVLVEQDLGFPRSDAVTDVRLFLGQGDEIRAAVALFDEIVLTVADVGRTFVIASAADDPDFGSFAALLTNGVDDSLTAEVHAGNILTNTSDVESRLLQGADGPLAPDLVGSTLQRVELTLEVLSVETPGEDPDGDGEGTDLRVVGRIVFFGVP